MKSLKCLIITTSNYKLDNTTNTTGVWLEDLAAPYFIFKDSGEHITLASPKGGLIPLDLSSQSEKYITENTRRFRENDQAMYHFSHSLPLNEIKAENFDLVFFSGGYGAMYDFEDNGILRGILSDFYYQNKPIGLVGHAIVALLAFSINSADSFVKGRKITAFSNSEELSIGVIEKPPFLLETRLRSSGALYSNGPDFKSNVVIDGSIITGQNPASSVETARQTLMMAHQQHQ
jgi:putative intracellular protease/amidase